MGTLLCTATHSDVSDLIAHLDIISDGANDPRLGVGMDIDRRDFSRDHQPRIRGNAAQHWHTSGNAKPSEDGAAQATGGDVVRHP